MPIVLATSYGYEGIGDFAFIKNTGLEILKAHPDEKLIFISQPEGISIYREILKVDHPNISLMDIKTFNENLTQHKISISLYIEGPVFNLDMHTGDELARETIIGPDLLTYRTQDKIQLPVNTTVLLIPEYGKIDKTERALLALQHELKRQGITNINILRTGFSKVHRESGIYFNHQLVASDINDEIALEQLSAIKTDQVFMKTLIENGSLEALFQEHDVSLEYSKKNCDIFLRMHQAWSSIRKKDQIIIGIGGGKKKEQLTKLLPELKRQFSLISYFNMASGEELILFASEATTKHTSYRFIHVDKLAHDTLLLLIQLCGPIMGATGDASLAEALSARKVIAYECEEHKINLAKSLAIELQTVSSIPGDFFREFFHRPTTGAPRSLSKDAISFLQSDEAILAYHSTMQSIHDAFDLSQTLIETIKSIKDKASMARSLTSQATIHQPLALSSHSLFRLRKKKHRPKPNLCVLSEECEETEAHTKKL